MKKSTLETLAGLTRNPVFTAKSITLLMEKLRLNARGFAIIMNVSVVTVREWLYEGVTPCAASRRLMQLFDTMPEIAELLADKPKK